MKEVKQASAPTRDLQQGMSGDDVKSVQKMLNAIGINVGSEDGIFGPKLFAGVIDFQRQHSLHPDGIVGVNTYTALLAMQGSQPSPTPSPTPAPSQNMVQGIDVSHYQKTVNWLQVKAMGIVFAFIKMSEGLGIDDTGKDHVAGAKKAGIMVGGYHFFHSSRDPLAQAKVFVTAFGQPKPGDLPLALDVEWADGLKILGEDGAHKALACLEEIERLSGRTPIIYTSAAFFKGMKNPAPFARFPLWIANYSATPAKCPPWTHATFHQFTDHEDVKGAGKIDGDHFLGTLDELQKLAGL